LDSLISSNVCPLCDSLSVNLLHTSKRKNLERDYLLCAVCDLVFVPSAFHVGTDAERERYLSHNNQVWDRSYRQFLGKLWQELSPKLTPGMSGLDFGAGPGPALAAMMDEDGFKVTIYDPLFQPNTDVLQRKYDFITCTETVEHFKRPREEFNLLINLLRPGGWLGVMTGMLDNRNGFHGWYYHLDPTHIGFYSSTTMRWISEWLGCVVEMPVPNVALFRKS